MRPAEYGRVPIRLVRNRGAAHREAAGGIGRQAAAEQEVADGVRIGVAGDRCRDHPGDAAERERDTEITGISDEVLLRSGRASTKHRVNRRDQGRPARLAAMA